MSTNQNLPPPANATPTAEPAQGDAACPICTSKHVPHQDGRLAEHRAPNGRTCPAGGSTIAAALAHLKRREASPHARRIMRSIQRDTARHAHTLRQRAATPRRPPRNGAGTRERQASAHESAARLALIRVWSTSTSATSSAAYAAYQQQPLASGGRHLSKRGWTYLVERLAKRGEVRTEIRTEPRDAAGNVGRVLHILPGGDQ